MMLCDDIKSIRKKRKKIRDVYFLRSCTMKSMICYVLCYRLNGNISDNSMNGNIFMSISRGNYICNTSMQ